MEKLKLQLAVADAIYKEAMCKIHDYPFSEERTQLGKQMKAVAMQCFAAIATEHGCSLIQLRSQITGGGSKS